MVLRLCFHSSVCDSLSDIVSCENLNAAAGVARKSLNEWMTLTSNKSARHMQK